MVKIIILILAVLVPLLPLGVWASQTIQGFAEAGDRLAVYLYFPARAFALIGFVLMFYQFVLSARMSFLEHVFTRPNLVKTHRTMGKIGFILVLLHGILMIATDFADFGALLFTWQKLIGMVALFLLTIGVIAAWFFKQLDFNVKTWRKIHLLAYVAFPLVFVHAITIGLTLRQSLPVTILFTMLFAWYVAMVAVRLFGSARGALHPAKPGAPKPAGATARTGTGSRSQTAAARPAPTPQSRRSAADADDRTAETNESSEQAKPAGPSGSESERVGKDSLGKDSPGEGS
jgi:DMSO/TMAO reductase YedYZ heme-binding membrane subunit